MSDRVRDFIKQNVGYLIVAFVCIIYVLTSYIVIDETGKSLARIIADGAIAFALGVFISTMLGLQGMMLGDKDERVRAAVEEHGRAVLRILGHIDRLDAWCELENKKNYKLQRSKILARAGLKYEDCFDEDGVARGRMSEIKQGVARDVRAAERRKMRAYRRAVKLKLTAISAGELTSEGGRQDDPYYFGRTKRRYETESGVRGLASRMGTAVLSAYYGARLVEDFSYASLIWTCLQVAVFLLTGVIKLYSDYNYVVGEFRARIIKKTDNLQKFENYVNSGDTRDEE